MTLNYGSFSKRTYFTLEGLININHCSFRRPEIEYQIFNGIWEPVPTAETVRSLKSFVADRVIKIFKSHFEIDKFIVDIMKTICKKAC